MPAVEFGAATAHFEVAHLALDPSRVVAPAAAHAAAATDLGEQRIAPTSDALRGERPLLAAFFA
jgi:hypothetical protein